MNIKNKCHIPHIGIFGKRNVGKSSFINALSDQKVSIVSKHAGTTTDPVKKQIELGQCGAIVLIDTAGIDDYGEVGNLRVLASKKVIEMIDLAIIVIANNNFDNHEREVVALLSEHNTPFIIIHNKADICKISSDLRQQMLAQYKLDDLEIYDFDSIKGFDYNNSNKAELINVIHKALPKSTFNNPTIIGDLINAGDVVLLVTPIDLEAPKGRMILPQMQTLRDALDNNCIVVTLKESELALFFKKCNASSGDQLLPKLVVTDSQAFAKVDAIVPKDIALTSFSILYARLKGDFDTFIKGTFAISNLKEKQNVLIMESCSHHVIGDDIARIKIPKWIDKFTGKKINYEVVASFDEPSKPFTDYSLLIQCGGCMFTRKQILNRMLAANKYKIPITNYGMTIAYTQGIFERAISPFKYSKLASQ
ncbi:MAG: [FeFe] hydrogenase H-cluster maturation GTPase HydF [Oligoflexia bacterium]|nr:[FeFe] hydrogenase H-cluster maturation GTPase HydF [Oligoflexia bacterium]